MSRLTVQEVLAPNGLVARKLGSYEQRPEQLEMAAEVARAFDDNEHLLVEAGTGVGKSFAYLVPAILRAVYEKQRVVISTYTIALQEQLIQRDLPFLSETLPVEFSAVLGKGRSNYLCYRRLGLAIQNRDKLFSSEDLIEQLEQVARWAMETETGSLQDIEFELQPAVWEKVRSEQGICRGGKCKHYKNCHLQAARRRMLESDIVVVNHALFFSDLALQSKEACLLGPYDLVVLDEAHTIEQVASTHFGMSVSSSSVHYLLRELYNERNNRGLLALSGDQAALDAALRAYKAADAFFEGLCDYDGPHKAANGRLSKPDVIPDELSPALKALAKELRGLRRNMKEEQAFEVMGYEQRLNELAENVQALIQQKQDDHAYWVTERKTSRGYSMVWLASAPINVSPIIKSLVFDNVNSAILTSATLSTRRGGEHGFEYARKRLGLIDEGRELQLESPFDYRKQARLYVETQLGEPNHLDTFVPAAAGAIEHYVRRSEGRAFVLFTSYRMLKAAAEQLEDFCEENDYELLVQGGRMARGQMLRRFRERKRCILLGTLSFWQGVDVAGEALQNVIITKLPFAAPNEPIVEARIERIRQAGGNPFGAYQLPEAVILFKQGFGRLIRTKSDSGFVVVLDHRISTRSYGKQFIGALPAIDVVYDEYAGSQNRDDQPPADLWEFM